MQTPYLDELISTINRRARTDLRPILAGLTWLFSGQVAVAIAGFLSTVLLARVLTEESFGTYKYLLTLLGMVGVLSLAGLKSATVRAVAQGYEGDLYRTVKLILRWSGGMIVSAAAIASYYWYMGNDLLAVAGLVMLIAVPLTTAFTTCFQYLNGKQLYRKFALARTIHLATPPAATLVALLFTKDILILFMSFVGGQILTAVGLFLYVIRAHPPNSNQSPDTVRYGTHLSFMNILGNLSFQLDKFLAWHLLGPAQLAAYAIATAIPQQLRVFNKIINGVVMPRFSRHSTYSIKTTIVYKMLLLEVFALLIVIPYWLAAPPLFEFVFPKYEEYVIYSQVFSLVLLLFPAALIKGALHAHAKTKELYLLNTGIPILKISLLFTLIPLLGLWGLIGTALLLETMSFALSLWLFYRTAPSKLTVNAHATEEDYQS